MWTRDHRMRHIYENINHELDHYSISKGLLWAHFINIFYLKNDKYNNEELKVTQELIEEKDIIIIIILILKILKLLKIYFVLT